MSDFAMAVDIVMGPDGQHAARIQLGVSHISATIVIPAEHTDTFADSIAREVKKAGREARRMNRQARGEKTIVGPNGAPLESGMAELIRQSREERDAQLSGNVQLGEN
jgi:hypothetical protein